MTRGTSLLLMLTLFVVAPILAQDEPDTGPQKVLIKLKSGSDGGPREIVLGPHAVATCKHNKGCSDHFTMRWVGSANDGEKLLVEFTTEGAADCFDKTSFTIDGPGPQNEQTVTVLSDNEACEPKTWYNYDISCIGGENDNCGGVERLDPGAMVGGGAG